MEFRVEERGSIGKLKRPNSRNKPTTPYDRPVVPVANQSNVTNKWGWLSKLVDPHRRLISTGAVKLFPSIFSTRSSDEALNTPCKDDELIQIADINQHEEAPRSKHVDSLTSTGVSNTTNIEDFSHEPGTNNMVDNKMIDLQDNNKMQLIEQILMKKFFSRDEIDHLVKILNSKVIDGSSVCMEKNIADLKIGRSTMDIHTSRLSCKPCEEVVAPVEIARAYMGSRGLDTGLGPVGKSSRFDKDLFGDEIVPEQSPKSPICWPGAVLNVQSSHETPQSRKSRFGLHNSPRTPYSRTMNSSRGVKTPKLEYSGVKSTDIPSTPGIYQNIPSSSLLVDSHRGMDERSVGPIRQRLSRIAMENNFRGSKFVPTRPNYLTEARSEDLLKKNQESELLSRDVQMRSTTQEPEANSLAPHTDSSSLARKILEHINRNTPTLKEKSAEVALAIRSKDTPGSSSNVMSKETVYHVGAPPDAGDDSRRNHILDKLKFPNKIEDEFHTGINSTLVSAVVPHNGNVLHNNSIFGRSTDAEKSDVSLHGKETMKDDPEKDVHDEERKAKPYTMGKKKTVESITISRPDSSSFGFTFPTTSLMEPPTPSLLPSVFLPRPKGENFHSDTLYNFGRECKSSENPLVFSFPFSDHIPNDSDIMFGFGSEDKHTSRLSFKI